MKKSLLCLIFLLLTITVFTQKRTQPKPKPTVTTSPSPTPTPSLEPTKVITPKTLVESVQINDGRTIQLFSDKTYEILLPTKPIVSNISVQFQGAVITGGGDVKAIARTDFIIFKEDILPALATVSDRQGKPLDAFGLFLAQKYQLSTGDTYAKAFEKIKPSIVGKFTTDFNGNSLITLPKQDDPYYIYGFFSIGRSSCVWYLKFPGNQNGSYIIENKNATFCG